MPDINDTAENYTLREIICMALHVTEISRQLFEGIQDANRADIKRNHGAIVRQISSCQDIVDRLNAIVDQVDGNTVVSAKVKDHPIITELIRENEAGNHVSIELVRHAESVSGIAYKVDGFYKSGTVTLVPLASGALLAIARYNERTELHDFRDLVSLNHDWWERSKGRCGDTWAAPAAGWVDWMVEFGYIQRNVRTVVEYTTAVL